MKLFENVNFWFDGDDTEPDRPLIVACKDRERKDSERWVVASLSAEEAKQLYEFLRAAFSEEEEP